MKKVWMLLVAVGLVAAAFILSRPVDENANPRSKEEQSSEQAELQDFRIELPETKSLAASGLDNPEEDGWDTEAFAAKAKKKLQQVLSNAAQPKAKRTETLPPAQVSFGNLESVYKTTGLNVRRLPADGENQETAIDRPLEDGLSELIEPLSSIGEPHFHIKVVGVSVEAQKTITTCIYEADASNEQTQIQQTGRFECEWGQPESDADAQLRSIRFTELEEVRRTVGSSWFVDYTVPVVGKSDAYQSQLSFGLNHWMERVERTYGMDDAVRTGLAIGDANGDGLDDVYLCQGPGLPNRLFLHQSDGTTKEVAAAAGVDFLDLTSSALFADFDNDGDQDLAIGTTAGLILMENTASQVANASQPSSEPAIPAFRKRLHLATEMTDSQSLAVADYDVDGNLDLFLCAYRHQSGRVHGEFVFHDATTGGRNYLFRNAGNWQFNDVTQASGLADGATRYSLAASWEDYDNDGDPDLYVANDYGRNYLYQNQGGVFRDASNDAGLTDTGFGMSVSWGDVNRDGNMDLYIGNMFSSAGSRITSQPKFQANASPQKRAMYQRMARGNSLFLNQAENGFDDFTTTANVGMGRWAWSSIFGDINNDGWEDLIVANGYITADDNGDL